MARRIVTPDGVYGGTRGDDDIAANEDWRQDQATATFRVPPLNLNPYVDRRHCMTVAIPQQLLFVAAINSLVDGAVTPVRTPHESAAGYFDLPRDRRATNGLPEDSIPVAAEYDHLRGQFRVSLFSHANRHRDLPAPFVVPNRVSFEYRNPPPATAIHIVDKLWFARASFGELGSGRAKLLWFGLSARDRSSPMLPHNILARWALGLWCERYGDWHGRLHVCWLEHNNLTSWPTFGRLALEQSLCWRQSSEYLLPDITNGPLPLPVLQNLCRGILILPSELSEPPAGYPGPPGV
jgi:hypothetical protein